MLTKGKRRKQYFRNSMALRSMSKWTTIPSDLCSNKVSDGYLRLGDSEHFLRDSLTTSRNHGYFEPTDTPM